MVDPINKSAPDRDELEKIYMELMEKYYENPDMIKEMYNVIEDEDRLDKKQKDFLQDLLKSVEKLSKQTGGWPFRSKNKNNNVEVSKEKAMENRKKLEKQLAELSGNSIDYSELLKRGGAGNWVLDAMKSHIYNKGKALVKGPHRDEKGQVHFTQSQEARFVKGREECEAKHRIFTPEYRECLKPYYGRAGYRKTRSRSRRRTRKQSLRKSRRRTRKRTLRKSRNRTRKSRKRTRKSRKRTRKSRKRTRKRTRK